jgi:hypothetical protein
MDINVNANRRGVSNTSRSNASAATNNTNGNASKGNLNANGKPISNAAQGEGNSKMPMIIIIVITILLFVFVILYITFAMKSNNLKGKAITTQPIDVAKSETPTQIGNSEFPKAAVGREYTYSFWLYLDNYQRTGLDNNSYYMVMYRGNSGSLENANPIIMMDNQSNKLYIIIKTTQSSLQDVNINTANIIKKNYFNSDTPLANSNTHLVCAIDFIPLQRWVHVACVVDNKLVTLFLDGQIYSVKTTDEFKSSKRPELDSMGNKVNYNLIIDKTEGDLVIGRSAISQRMAIDGWVGKIEFFNYALTVDNVRQIYQQGPMPKGFLSWLGLSQYGFRSPIYNMSSAN